MSLPSLSGEQVNTGFLVSSLRNFIQPHQHFDLHVLWINHGTGTLRVGNTVYLLEAGTTCCLVERQCFEICDTNNINGYYIGSNESSLPALPSRLQLDTDTLNDTGILLERMTTEYGRNNQFRMPILQGLFHTFLLYLFSSRKRDMQDHTKARELQILHLFKGLMREKIAEKKLVADYASMLHVTPGYLNQVIKRVSGFTASYHIQQQVVLEAKKRIAVSAASMKEIAYGLGFEDSAHFSKFFKQNSGINFSRFRKEIPVAGAFDS